ncbi:FAS1 domain-containing protein-like protein [Cinnamomum micranthum f. kanehirae]|uniref:FAS1 domain-containing protein-like protein n=1 Tax=Cinnamomum micranthum f. kanehirae TaxID=337451 RepID=A0A443PUX3_9MAGN|nr:FAS1 domain-containing protein-like protein [Cinnamomum micranthum f. kanehirae]
MKILISFLLLLGTFGSIFGLGPPNPVNQLSRNSKHHAISIDMGLTLDDLISSVQLKKIRFPTSFTLFLPTDENMDFVNKQLASDPSILSYHYVPQALSSCDLKRNFLQGSLIPTLLAGNSIKVTSNTIWNFTINGSPISHPDMFNSPFLAVHGIPTILNYTWHGGSNSPPPQQPPKQPKNDAGVVSPSPLPLPPSPSPLVQPEQPKNVIGVASPPPQQPKTDIGVASPPQSPEPPPKTSSSAGSSNQPSVAPGLFVQFGMIAFFAVAAFFLS